MKYEYKTVDTNTIKGIETAEILKDKGWKIIRSSLFSIQFERERPMKRRLVETNKCECGTVVSKDYDICENCCDQDYDSDESNMCLQCGKDGTEEVMSAGL